MHAISGNIKFKPYSDANNVIYKLFKSLRSKFQVSLITSMRESDFIFDSVQLMYYKCHRVKFIAGGVTYCFFIQNILYIKEKEIYSASVSKINSNCENK